MKQLFAGLILMMVANCGWSQEAMPQLKLKPRVADTSVQIFSKLTANPVTIFSTDSTRISHFTNKGTVYTLPQDKMPWLKSNNDLVDNIPVKSDLGNGYIPNGYLPNKRELLLQMLRKKALE